MIFPYHSVHFASKTDYDITKHTVIHIQTTFPYHLTWINTKLISLLNMIIHHCCKQVICIIDPLPCTA